MKRLITFVFILALGFKVNASEEFKHPWARFKEGAWAKYRTTAKKGAKLEVENTIYTLVKLTESEAVVKGEIETNGQKTEIEEKISLKPTEKGEEEIELAGKKWKCKVFETKSNMETVTFWICKETPYENVEIKSKIAYKEDGTLTLTLTKFEKEVLKVKGKELKCLVYDAKLEDGGFEFAGKAWSSEDVPGHGVKVQFKGSMQDQTVESQTKLVDFEVK